MQWMQWQIRLFSWYPSKLGQRCGCIILQPHRLANQSGWKESHGPAHPVHHGSPMPQDLQMQLICRTCFGCVYVARQRDAAQLCKFKKFFQQPNALYEPQLHEATPMPHAPCWHIVSNCKSVSVYVALVPVGQTQTQFFPRKSHNAWHGPGIALCGTSPCVLSANSQVMLSPIPRERRTRDEREHLSFSRKPRPHERKTTESVLSRCRNSCTSHFSLHGEVRQSWCLMLRNKIVLWATWLGVICCESGTNAGICRCKIWPQRPKLRGPHLRLWSSLGASWRGRIFQRSDV